MANHKGDALTKLVTADGGLPHPSPTSSAWMLPLSSLANVQSKSLPPERDVIVIGSGITAASVTRALLRQDPTCKVSVLEARSLCSGATGRNGGHLITASATEIVKFTFENIKKTKGLLQEYASENEYREVTRYRCFGDQASFREAFESVQEFEKDNPSMSGLYRFADNREASQVYGIHNTAGMCMFRAGALSPYRLVTSIFERLLEQYDEVRLSLEMNTPVLDVAHDANGEARHPYVLTTSRGVVRATHVVYCTNGYAGHLLPQLRGPLFPLRGSMTVQDLGGRLPNRGSSASWSLHCQPSYDEQSGRCAVGTYYIQQNPSSGYFFIGGEAETASDTITQDDSQSPPNSEACLRRELLKLFNLKEESGDRVIKHWTGIMGYTADGLPLVGQLPSVATGRSGKGEWIAAGFNGMGMSMCVASGESVAQSLLGAKSDISVPSAFQITLSRLRDRLTTEQSVEGLSSMFPMLTASHSRL